MKNLRLIAAACLCALGLLSMPAAAETKEIVLWHAYRAEEKSALEKMIAQFNAANASKGIHVSTLVVPYDAFADKISATVPRGKGPDLFIFAQDRLGGWSEAGNTVEPIDFYLDDALRKRFIPSTLEAMTYRGTVYGLPLNYKVITLIYNKKLVPTPPKTSGELVTMAKKLTDVKAGRFGLAYSYADFYYHAALLNGFGGGVFGPGATPTLNSPQNVKSAELLLKWVDKDGIMPVEPSTALITSLFNEGKAGMVFSGPWFLGEISKDVDYGLAPLPTLDEAGGKPMRPWMTVEGVFISGSSKNKDAAFEVAKFLSSEEVAKVLAVEGRQSPANQAAYADPRIAGDAQLKAFRQQVEVAVPMPNVPEMSMVWSPATSAMNAILKKSSTPKAALDVAQKSVAKDVAGLRKK
ncbi:extracellular solute-binding protein [Vitiosangium sp. GDMCC 1.1324]|uniref:extracellular solute-binding protein n=1 Tax=Vitiosangium sp. (strain GDMCC 1.1324) TaxID=2138576 RepID=UPI000D38510B|nr:extracellular solute-binding protein [Vitiosangium sp. GDMCC 1.1324]PTL82930.1 ABC transporter substrate-binding protein [Vitiosangium sp. GDMCC 1.1324]